MGAPSLIGAPADTLLPSYRTPKPELWPSTWLLLVDLILLSFDLYRYLDNVVNKQSISPPIPHLHALLTSGDDPPVEVDIFDLLRVSYEVSFLQD